MGKHMKGSRQQDRFDGWPQQWERNAHIQLLDRLHSGLGLEFPCAGGHIEHVFITRRKREKRRLWLQSSGRN